MSLPDHLLDVPCLDGWCEQHEVAYDSGEACPLCQREWQDEAAEAWAEERVTQEQAERRAQGRAR